MTLKLKFFKAPVKNGFIKSAKITCKLDTLENTGPISLDPSNQFSDKAPAFIEDSNLSSFFNQPSPFVFSTSNITDNGIKVSQTSMAFTRKEEFKRTAFDLKSPKETRVPEISHPFKASEDPSAKKQNFKSFRSRCKRFKKFLKNSGINQETIYYVSSRVTADSISINDTSSVLSTAHSEIMMKLETDRQFPAVNSICAPTISSQTQECSYKHDPHSVRWKRICQLSLRTLRKIISAIKIFSRKFKFFYSSYQPIDKNDYRESISGEFSEKEKIDNGLWSTLSPCIQKLSSVASKIPSNFFNEIFNFSKKVFGCDYIFKIQSRFLLCLISQWMQKVRAVATEGGSEQSSYSYESKPSSSQDKSFNILSPQCSIFEFLNFFEKSNSPSTSQSLFFWGSFNTLSSASEFEPKVLPTIHYSKDISSADPKYFKSPAIDDFDLYICLGLFSFCVAKQIIEIVPSVLSENVRNVNFRKPKPINPRNSDQRKETMKSSFGSNLFLSRISFHEFQCLSSQVRHQMDRKSMFFKLIGKNILTKKDVSIAGKKEESLSTSLIASQNTQTFCFLPREIISVDLKRLILTYEQVSPKLSVGEDHSQNPGLFIWRFESPLQLKGIFDQGYDCIDCSSISEELFTTDQDPKVNNIEFVEPNPPEFSFKCLPSEDLEENLCSYNTLWDALHLKNDADNQMIMNEDNEGQEISVIRDLKDFFPDLRHLNYITLSKANFGYDGDQNCIHQQKVSFGGKNDQNGHIESVVYFEANEESSMLKKISFSVPSKGILKRPKTLSFSDCIRPMDFNQPLDAQEIVLLDKQLRIKACNCKRNLWKLNQKHNLWDLKEVLGLFFDCFEFCREHFTEVATSQTLEYIYCLDELRKNAESTASLMGGVGNQYSYLIGIIEDSSISENSLDFIEATATDILKSNSVTGERLGGLQNFLGHMKYGYNDFIPKIKKLAQLALLHVHELSVLYEELCRCYVEDTIDRSVVDNLTGYREFTKHLSFLQSIEEDFGGSLFEDLSNLEVAHDMVYAAKEIIESNTRDILSNIKLVRLDIQLDCDDFLTI